LSGEKNLPFYLSANNKGMSFYQFILLAIFVKQIFEVIALIFIFLPIFFYLCNLQDSSNSTEHKICHI